MQREKMNPFVCSWSKTQQSEDVGKEEKEWYLFSDGVSRHQLRFDGDEEGEERAFA